MTDKIILRLSNEVGNQMFMYASAYGIAKKMNRVLLLDDETAFQLKKNISSYGLNHFNISSSIAPDKLKFKKLSGYMRRKLFLKTDFLRKNKIFYLEKKNINKLTKYNLDFVNANFDKDLRLEGHFESEKYFHQVSDEIRNEFIFKNDKLYKNNDYFTTIRDSNSIGICLRQNRFTEGKSNVNQINKVKSNKFSIEQINYINKSVTLIKSKIPNPKFFLWSNDITSIPINNFNFDFKLIDQSKVDSDFDKRIFGLFLLSNCKHFIVSTSTFNWWGAWLSNYKNKLIIRPSNDFFTDFKINNADYWPDNWLCINPRN